MITEDQITYDDVEGAVRELADKASELMGFSVPSEMMWEDVRREAGGERTITALSGAIVRLAAELRGESAAADMVLTSADGEALTAELETDRYLALAAAGRQGQPVRHSQAWGVPAEHAELTHRGDTAEAIVARHRNSGMFGNPGRSRVRGLTHVLASDDDPTETDNPSQGGDATIAHYLEMQQRMVTPAAGHERPRSSSGPLRRPVTRPSQIRVPDRASGAVRMAQPVGWSDPAVLVPAADCLQT